jgi:hypothetical protein
MYANMSESDRGSRALISSDQCVIDEKWVFIRGCLEIPIVDNSEVFLWGLWASVKEEAFNEISASWEEAEKDSGDPSKVVWQIHSLYTQKRST